MKTNFRYMKKCTKCKSKKPLTDFYSSVNTKDNLHSWCKPCFRENTRNDYLKRSFGIEIADYEAMLSMQDYGCAICGKKDDTLLRSGVYKRLCVDHNHKTGKLRGILCENCNRGIGLFKDSQELLENAINYLNQF